MKESRDRTWCHLRDIGAPNRISTTSNTHPSRPQNSKFTTVEMYELDLPPERDICGTSDNCGIQTCDESYCDGDPDCGQRNDYRSKHGKSGQSIWMRSCGNTHSHWHCYRRAIRAARCPESLRTSLRHENNTQGNRDDPLNLMESMGS